MPCYFGLLVPHAGGREEAEIPKRKMDMQGRISKPIKRLSFLLSEFRSPVELKPPFWKRRISWKTYPTQQKRPQTHISPSLLY